MVLRDCGATWEGGWRSNIVVDGEGWAWSYGMLTYGEESGTHPQQRLCGTRRIPPRREIEGKGQRQRSDPDPPWD